MSKTLTKTFRLFYMIRSYSNNPESLQIICYIYVDNLRILPSNLGKLFLKICIFIMKVVFQNDILLLFNGLLLLWSRR